MLQGCTALFVVGMYLPATWEASWLCWCACLALVWTLVLKCMQCAGPLKQHMAVVLCLLGTGAPLNLLLQSQYVYVTLLRWCA